MFGHCGKHGGRGAQPRGRRDGHAFGGGRGCGSGLGRGRGRGIGGGRIGSSAGSRPVVPPQATRTKDALPAQAATKQATTAQTAAQQAAMDPAGSEGRCPLCKNHCPLSAPSCAKGRAYARSMAAPGGNA